MKVAISLPDSLGLAVDDMAMRLGVSRSEFFATAARRYLDEVQRHSLTASIDEAVTLVGGGQDRDVLTWTRAAAQGLTPGNPW